MDIGERASDERKKWEKPYVFQPYPKMLYRGIDEKPGWMHCTVEDEREEHEKTESGEGWFDTLPVALKYREKLAADIGVAAAERAFTDRKMSAAAQAEAKAAEDAADGHHIGEIPETPLKPKALKKVLDKNDLPKDE